MSLYRVSTDKLEPVSRTTFAAESLLERKDLQRLLRRRHREDRCERCYLNDRIMSKKYREIQSQGPKSTVGQTRRELYARSLARVKEAMEAGYSIEAVALLEGMISDRLEARLAHKNSQAKDKRKLSTLVTLAEELRGKNSDDPDSAKEVYGRVIVWADDRNNAVHELVKLVENGSETWEMKYSEAKEAAKNGLSLFRDVSKTVASLNLPNTQA